MLTNDPNTLITIIGGSGFIGQALAARAFAPDPVDQQQRIGCRLDDGGQGMLYKFAQAFASSQAPYRQQQALVAKLVALPKML